MYVFISLLGLFQVMMASHFLKREIRQFIKKPAADHFHSTVAPLNSNSTAGGSILGNTINILWVPANLGEETFNHIVPLLPYKCGCVGNDLCLFSYGMNKEWKEKKSEFVKCRKCNEMYHACCLGYTKRQFSRINADCGCQSLQENLESKDRYL